MFQLDRHPRCLLLHAALPALRRGTAIVRVHREPAESDSCTTAVSREDKGEDRPDTKGP